MIINAALTLQEVNVLLISLDYVLDCMEDDGSNIKSKVSGLIHKLEGLLPGDEYTLQNAMEDKDNV